MTPKQQIPVNPTYVLSHPCRRQNIRPPVTTTIADAAMPLLPTMKRDNIADATTGGGASLSGAVFNVSTSIIGAGIMSIPATLKVLGLVPASFLIIVVAVLTDLSIELLLRSTYSSKTTTYAGVMGESFGRVGSVLAQVFVIITTCGLLIIYLIILGDVLSGKKHGGSLHLGVLQEWFGSHWWNTRPYALLFIVVFILLPLVLFRHIESLRFSSAVSVLLAVVFVGISSVMAIIALIKGKTQKLRLFPDLNNHSSIFDLFTAVPVIVTAFTFHFNVHQISSELNKPSKMTQATRISVLLCAAIFFAVGFFGYLLFGDSLATDLLVNFDRNSSDNPLLNDIVRLSYALHLVLVFPVLNFSLRANIDELIFPKKPILASDNTRFLTLTFLILAFTYLAAIAIPDIWIFFQYVGSTTAVSLALIFPGALILRDVHGMYSTRDKIFATVMVILAVGTSTIAIATDIYNSKGSQK